MAGPSLSGGGPSLRWIQRWRGTPAESRSLLFALTVYREPEQLEWCLHRLREAYPSVEVLVISDGDPDPAYPRLARRFGVGYEAGERLKVPGRGGEYCHRLFERFLATRHDVLVKIDPDSWVRRPFRYFPRAHFFGTVLWPDEVVRHVQGGCQGFTREACRRVVASGVSRDPAYRDPERSYRDLYLRRRVEDYHRRRGQLAVDFMVHDMMARIGITSRDWLEVDCRWPEPPPERGDRHAVTHPHRLHRG